MEKKILFVDDEEPILKMFSDIFSTFGFTPRCTADGNEALKILKEEDIRIMFTDLRMPIMDGMEVCRRAREIDANVHIYAVSAFVATYTPEQFVKVGFTGSFRKPFNIAELTEAANKAFEGVEE